MPPFLFVSVVWAGWTDPPLDVSEAIECVERRHGEEVNLFHFLDNRVRLGKGTACHFLLRRQGSVLGGSVRLFQLGQDLLRPGDDCVWKTRQLGDMNTIATVCTPRHNFTEEYHVAIAFLDCHAVVLDALA